MSTKRDRQLKQLSTKLSKALVQVERIRTGKLKRRTLMELVNAALSKPA